jgi:hypothetical protein
MFVSRTVAAEVLMEAEANGTAYAVLRALDQEGGLRFSLPYVSRSPLSDIADFGRTSSLVEDLIKVASFRTMSPKHFSDVRSLVMYQDARNHHARDGGSPSVLMEGFSKLEPYRSSCHTSDRLYRRFYSDSGCLALRPTTPQPDTRLHRRHRPCSSQPICGSLFVHLTLC